MDNICWLVRPHGRLFIANYHDQGSTSRWWALVMWLYNRSALARVVLIAGYMPCFIGLRWIYPKVTGRGKPERGLSLWYGMIDWLGDWPFEVAKPEAVFRFFAARGFELRALTTADRKGACNEFVFERVREAQPCGGEPRTE